MKKTLLTIFCAFIGLFSFAQDTKTYTDQLIITINGTSSDPKTTDVTVIDNGDGTIDFEMKNFFMVQEGNYIPVGNIYIENLLVTEGDDGLQHITFDAPMVIQPGDMEGIAESDWIGPLFGEIPLNLRGKMNDEKFYAIINIDLQETLGQYLVVQFGTDDFSQTNKRIYTEQLLVTINDNTLAPQTTDVVIVDNADGTINFTMKNFFLAAGEENMPIGNIALENMSVTEGDDGLKYFTFAGPMIIQPGDMEGIAESDWIGPLVGEIPLDLKGKMNDEKLYAAIDVDMQASLGQILFIQFGTDDFFVSGKIGDLNGDGKVDIADAVSVLDLMAEGTYSKDADINGDEKVDIADFVSILDIMAEQ